MTHGPDASSARREVLTLAWPIVLANATVPLLGLVDTAVIGNVGTVVDLGAIALGALVFSFVYWSFGFLRMGTTGFAAQASGSGDSAEVRATLARAGIFAIVAGLTLILLRRPVIDLSAALLGASAEVEALTAAYVRLRIWGAPATLTTFALLGTLVGLGRTREVLAVQLVLNGLNIALDVLLAGVLGLGVPGIAMGTAIAEWSAGLFAALLVFRVLSADRNDEEPFLPWSRILDRERAAQAVRANLDIMIRTLFLLMGFAWFTDRGARFGDEILAANHVLLQLVTTSAYLLDGYAHATEVLVGRAVGAKQRSSLDRAVRSATELALGSAVALGLLVALLGPSLVELVTDLPGVRAIAISYLPWTVLYVTCSFAAFQLDGIFIGATGTRDMRNAGAVSFVVFVAASWLLMPLAGNAGLWAAFVVYVVTRALTLAARYPALRRSVTATP